MPLATPWPTALELDFEAETEEGADHDDDPEDRRVLERRAHRHGPDDVASYEDLEAEEDGPADATAGTCGTGRPPADRPG